VLNECTLFVFRLISASCVTLLPFSHLASWDSKVSIRYALQNIVLHFTYFILFYEKVPVHILFFTYYILGKFAILVFMSEWVSESLNHSFSWFVHNTTNLFWNKTSECLNWVIWVNNLFKNINSEMKHHYWVFLRDVQRLSCGFIWAIFASRAKHMKYMDILCHVELFGIVLVITCSWITVQQHSFSCDIKKMFSCWCSNYNIISPDSMGEIQGEWALCTALFPVKD